MAKTNQQDPKPNDNAPDEAAAAKAAADKAEKEAADAAVKAEADAKAAAAKKPTSDPHEGLVKVRKGDDVLHVHPTTVHDHHAAGWKAD